MTVLFDGIASGMLLFIISVGLSVTLGLMNFINLAHGAFAMLGGYVCVTLLSKLGVPFLAALPVVAVIGGLVGVIFERLLYRRLYKATHLDQVLFSIALVLMSVAGAQYLFGASQQPISLPSYLSGQLSIGGADIGKYRLFLIGVGAVIAALLQSAVTYTRFGSQLRAAVDSPRVAGAMGINVDMLFVLTFALGTALAALGGALSIDTLGLDPEFAIKYIVYFLIVITVGGSGSIAGSLVASLILGVVDVVGKYYVPEVGAFLIYTVMVVTLIIRPQGLFGRK